jgi:membrane-bound lytic murein transglycosylase D
LKSAIIIFLFFISFVAFSQQANIDESIYPKNFDDILDNEYVKTLFKKSTLNTDSILKNVKPPKPFHPEKGDEILKSIEKTIPLNYHPEVNSFIAIYSKGVNVHFLNYMINYYQPAIIDELKKQGLPEELSFLPAILSDFNPYSANGIGGEGYWHLYYPQAIKQGLKINEYVDERRDFTKSTRAAIGYLKLLHNEYQDWELTLAAYICGPTTINNIMLRKKVSNYWEIYPFLNPKVRDVVPALTALIYNYSRNSSNQIKIDPQIEADTFYVKNKLAYKAIFDIVELNKKEVQFLNPTIINEVFPKNYMALFPKNTAKKMNLLSDSIYYYQDSVLFKPVVEKEDSEVVATEQEEIIHKVKSGDVLGKIAEKYGVKISQLQEWNKLKGTTINIGQNLIVYKKKPEARSPKSEVSSSQSTVLKPQTSNPPVVGQALEPETYIYYTVKEGDNLWDISLNYDDVTPDDIMELNNIDANLKVGQVLKIKKK